MAEEATQEAQAAPDGGAEIQIEEKKGGLSGKKLVLIVVLPLVLLSGGGAGAYFMGLLDPLLGKEVPVEEASADHAESQPAEPSVFFDLKEMLVNLNTGGRKSHYLKISVSLEVDTDDDVLQIQRVMPRIVDSFQVYLRELRIEDLQGSAGLQRLREELLMRVNSAAQPTVVRDVLFREMLVQ